MGIYQTNVCFHNRSETHINARKSYGGVAAIFKLDMYNEYDFAVVDKSVDGLMILRFTHKLTDHAFLLACCYLPPEQSVWGRDAVHFFRIFVAICTITVTMMHFIYVLTWTAI